MSSSIRTLGTLRHPRTISSSTKPSELVLSISNRLDLDQNIIEDTIIHEMIHLYIIWFRIPDSSAHGRTFRQIMSYINSRYGRNITISHRGNDEEKKTDRILKPRIVLISHLKTGERCVTVCSPKYSLSIYRNLIKNSHISQLQIIASYNPIFSTFPASKTPKIYRIPQATLDEALENAVFFKYSEGRFLPIR